MNDRVDLSRESLNKEGNVWLNRKNKQIRASLGENEPNSWYNPISVYEVGSINKIKRGQPVSVGYLDQLYEESKLSGDSCIVPTDPSINQWCIGLALEPGEHRNSNDYRKIHVQSSGQIEYKLSDKDKDNYYIPPYTNDKFDWTYDDIGKPVFVSNKNPGELTLDIAEAAYNGGTIVSVGRIADAPIPNEASIDLQRIVIEVQLSGDTRGVIDTSQIQVEIASKAKHQSLGIRVENIESALDRIFFFFIKDGLAYFILDDETINKYSKNSPVGALVVNSIDGILDIESLCGAKTLVYRLGLLKGNFGFTKIGNTAYLSNGIIDESSSSSSYDYKVGVILKEDQILIDCRYPRFINKKAMIGDIKPLFENGLVEPGYAKVDTNVHKVIFDRNDTLCSDNIDWYDLIEGTYTKDLFVFSRSPEGPFTTILEGGWTPEGAGEDSTGFLNKFTYFKFRDLIYTFGDNSCGCQIKISKDDQPEAMNYIWPEQTFQLSLVPDPGRYNDENYVLGGDLQSSRLKIDISKITALGAYMDSNGQNIEAYDIIVREKESNQLITSGFYQIKDTETDKMKWCGFEWKIAQDNNTNKTYLIMITVPGEEPINSCLGFCWPIGKKLSERVDLYVTVRRRPTQYHELYLNQLNQNNPWIPYTDGHNLITGDAIYFGPKLRETPADSEVGQNSGYNRENIGTGEIRFSSSNNEASINEIISEPDANENRIDILYDIKSIATRSNNDNIRRYIKWVYNFEDNVTELTSSFAPNLVQPSTMKEKIFGYENGSNNIIRDYTAKALQILHEFQPKIFNYIDDDSETINTWNKVSLLFEDVVNAANNDNEYTIFNNDSLASTKYKINGAVRNDIEDAISYLYGNSRGYLSYITNIGLLNKAASETQSRLLKIERALYGSDFETNPSGQKNKFDPEYLDIDNALSNAGVLRDLYSLRKQGLILEENKDSLSLKKVDGLSTLLRDLYLTNYAEYDSYETFTQEKTNFDIIQTLYEKDGDINHLYTLWIDYCNNNRTNLQLSYMNSFITGAFSVPQKNINNNYVIRGTNFYQEPSSISADKIYLLKYKKQYNNETKNIENESIGIDLEKSDYNGFPLRWPLYSDADFKNIDYYKIFFNTFICGFNDKDADIPESFNALSLEGLLLDIYLKLSYIRNSFNLDGSIKKNTIFSKFYTFLGENFRIDSDSEPLKDGVYSAFELKDGLFNKGYFLQMCETNEKTYYANNIKYNTASGSSLDAQHYTEFIRKFNNSYSRTSRLYNVNIDVNSEYFKIFSLYGCATLAQYIFEYGIDEDQETQNTNISTYLKILFVKAMARLNYNVLELSIPENSNLVEVVDNKFYYFNHHYWNFYGSLNSRDNNLILTWCKKFIFEEEYDIVSLDDIDTLPEGSPRFIIDESNISRKDFYSSILNIQTNGLPHSEFLNDFLSKSKYLHDQACVILFPSFNNASYLKDIFSSDINIYERRYPINEFIQSTCISILSQNAASTEGIFVDYENNTDQDQRALDDSSNDINKSLKLEIKEDEDKLVNFSHLEEIATGYQDIILDKEITTVLNPEDQSKSYALMNKSSLQDRDQLYYEDGLYVGDQLVDRNTTETNKKFINLSSLKTQIDTYTSDLNTSLESYNTTLKNEFNRLITSINNIEDGTNSNLENLTNKITEIFDNIFNSLDTYVSDLKSSTEEALTDITTNDDSNISSLNTYSETLKRIISESFNNLKTHLKSSFEDLTTELSLYNSSLNTSINELIGKVIDGLNTSNETYNNALVESIKSLFNSSRVDSILNTETNISSLIKEELNSFKDEHINDEYWSLFEETFEDFVQNDFTSFKEYSRILNTVNCTVEPPTTGNLPDDFDDRVDYVNNTLSELKNYIDQFTIADINQKLFKDGIKSLYDDIVESINIEKQEYELDDDTIIEQDDFGFAYSDDSLSFEEIEQLDLSDHSYSSLGDLSSTEVDTSLNYTELTENIANSNISKSQVNNNIEDLKLSVGGSSQNGISIYQKGINIDLTTVGPRNISYATNAFNNKDINKTLNILKSETVDPDGTYKKFSFEDFNIFEYIKTKFANEIREIVLQECNIRLTNDPTGDENYTIIEDFEEFRNYDDEEHIGILKTSFNEIIKGSTLSEGAKGSFIKSLFNSAEILFIENKDFRCDVNSLYRTIRNFYDSKVDLYSKEHVLTMSSKIKSGYKLFGKQQKRPSILFDIKGNDVIKLTRPEYFEGTETYIHESTSSQSPNWSRGGGFIFSDVFDREIKFTYNGRQYSIQKVSGCKYETNGGKEHLHLYISVGRTQAFKKQITNELKNFILTPEITSGTNLVSLSILNDAFDIKALISNENDSIRAEYDSSRNVYGLIKSNQQYIEEKPYFAGDQIKIDFIDKLDFILDSAYIMTFDNSSSIGYNGSGELAIVGEFTNSLKEYNSVHFMKLRDLNLSDLRVE